ncbi:MAG: hypothetical protein H6849_00225 [Alphaproteobacteria bacterium]|nr:MAG: hypothetical protein H6849_00225 [Alphaproteobacteria bacterium]
MRYISEPREKTIDRLRVIFFMLMLVDHTLHGYAQYWGSFWFVHDVDRSLLCDVLYLHNNSVIIPMLFFVSGFCVYGSLMRWGLCAYMWRRACYLLGTAVAGVIFLVPWMAYGKFVLEASVSLSFYDFLTTQFFTGAKLQAGPMWVLYAIFLYGSMAAGGLVLMGKVRTQRLGQVIARLIAAHPWCSLATVMGVCAILLGVMDIRYGAPWWIGGWKVFHFQGSRFLVQALFFAIGVGASLIPEADRVILMGRLMHALPVLMCGLFGVGVLYIGYAMLWYSEGAYSSDLYYYYNGYIPQGSPMEIITAIAPGILIRTSLHGIFLPLQIVCYGGLVYRFCSLSWMVIDYWKDKTLGLFLYHPIFVIGGQVLLYGYDIPVIVKIILVVTGSYVGTLGLTLATRRIFSRLTSAFS